MVHLVQFHGLNDPDRSAHGDPRPLEVHVAELIMCYEQPSLRLLDRAAAMESLEHDTGLGMELGTGSMSM